MIHTCQDASLYLHGEKDYTAALIFVLSVTLSAHCRQSKDEAEQGEYPSKVLLLAVNRLNSADAGK